MEPTILPLLQFVNGTDTTSQPTTNIFPPTTIPLSSQSHLNGHTTQAFRPLLISTDIFSSGVGRCNIFFLILTDRFSSRVGRCKNFLPFQRIDFHRELDAATKFLILTDKFSSRIGRCKNFLRFQRIYFHQKLEVINISRAFIDFQWIFHINLSYTYIIHFKDFYLDFLFALRLNNAATKQ